jgi:hypothetical protein
MMGTENSWDNFLRHGLIRTPGRITPRASAQAVIRDQVLIARANKLIANRTKVRAAAHPGC